jgi:hypothetical protein
MSNPFEALEAIVARLGDADWKQRDVIKEELLAAIIALPSLSGVEDFLGELKKSMELELRWEVDEVIERMQPEPEAEEPEAEEPEEEDPNRPLTGADLVLVYDDPRGLTLHRTKTGDRWFATQGDPATGQPQTFPIQAHQVEQLKVQLAGSPYWVLGSGA